MALYFEGTWISILVGEEFVDHHCFQLKSGIVLLLKENLPRTNNKIKGWHNGFSSMLSSTRPSRPIIWKFIDYLKKEESLTKMTSEQLLAGYVPNKKKSIMIYQIEIDY